MIGKIKKILITTFCISIVLTMAMYWYDQYTYYFTNDNISNSSSQCQEGSNIAIISIHGSIYTYTYLVDPSSLDETDSSSYDVVSSEDITGYINEIEANDSIKGVIVEIDSHGGSPVGSEEIMNAIKNMEKPTVAVIRESGASGGYLIASGADRIYASEMSDVGSIGVTMSYLDYSKQNTKEGITYQQLSSGKFKDSGDPDKVLTAQEKALLMRDVNITHEIFVRKVAENRKLDIKKVEKLADGSTMLGTAAKENGLIDEIGDINDAIGWLSGQLGIDPVICVY